MARGRMIDKVIILSKKINAVSEGAENLYYRIYVNTDDFGLFHADPTILKGQVYTLRKTPVATIEKRLNELINIGLIRIYKNNDEKYLEVVDFEKHQTFRKDYTRKYEYPKPNTNLYEAVRNRTESPSKLNKIKLKLNENKLNQSSLCSESKIPNEIDIRLTQILVDKILENNPKSHIVKSLTEKRQSVWIDACRKLREIDGRSEEEIEKIIIWCQQDDFWKANILSMPKVRKKFDQLFLKAKRDGGYDKFITGGDW